MKVSFTVVGTSPPRSLHVNVAVLAFIEPFSCGMQR